MPQVLSANGYTFPGTYIGRVQTPQPSVTSQPRVVCNIGKGNRLLTLYDQPITRSFLTGVALSFTTRPPYIAALAHAAVNNKQISRLYTSNGTPVPTSKWTFSQSTLNGPFNQVLIDAATFDPNASYFIDYQSTDRTIEDQLPFADLRSILLVGDVQQQSRYIENRDFRIPLSYVPITPALTNGHQTSAFFPANPTPLTHVGSGSGTLTFDVSANYTGRYSRKYVFTVANVSSPHVTFTWTATTISGQDINALAGIAAFPDLPLTGPSGNPARIVVDVTAGIFSPVDANHGAPSNLGIVLLPSAVATNFTIGDTYTGYAIAPQLLELEGTYNNTNQFPVVGPVVTTLAGGSTGSMNINTNTNYTGITNRRYVFRVTVATGVSPNRAATIAWQGFGENGSTYGSIQIQENNALLPLTNRTVENGLSVNFSFGATQFIAETSTTAGDEFDVKVEAPRTAPTSKDSRSYVLTVISAAAGAVDLEYQGSTPEAGFATQIANGPEATILLPGNVQFYVRNVGDGTIPSAVVDYATNDSFTFAITDSGLIDWSLETVDVETFNTSSILTDTIGLVTGIPGAQYIVLQYPPDPTSYVRTLQVPGGGPFTLTLDKLSLLGTGNTVSINIQDTTSSTTLVQVASGTAPSSGQFSVNPTTGLITFNSAQSGNSVTVTFTGPYVNHVILSSTFAEIPYQVIPASTTAYTQYLVFTSSAPASNFEVNYVWKGLEPDPGNVYFITANVLRPLSQYNSLITAYTPDQMQRLMGPAATDNDLFIAGDLDMNAVGANIATFIQAYDSDGDGIVSTTDLQNAIAASETTSVPTDIIVLNGFNTLANQLDSNVRMNDPFQRKDRALWVGAPIGTPIGDSNTPGSLVYLATQTMQVFGNNPAHGTRILLGNTLATKALILPDGTTVTVTLDGSFVASASAALNTTFTDPSTMILKQTLPGFVTMQTYQEVDELRIGAASILYLKDVGSGVFQFNESVTVDTSTPDNNEISALNQKQFVTRDVRTQMDDKLIAFVPDNVAVGVATITAFLAQLLDQYVSRGITAAYTDASGNVRPIQPETDIEVFRDVSDPLLYHFNYWYNIKYGIKRLNGLYSVDRAFFSTPPAQ